MPGRLKRLKKRHIAAILALALLLACAYLWYPRSFSRYLRDLDTAADARLSAMYYEPVTLPDGRQRGEWSHFELEHGGEAAAELLDILSRYTYRHSLTGVLERRTPLEYDWMVHVSAEDWSVDLNTNEYGYYQLGLDVKLRLPDGDERSLTIIAYRQDELLAEVNALLEESDSQ